MVIFWTLLDHLDQCAMVDHCLFRARVYKAARMYPACLLGTHSGGILKNGWRGTHYIHIMNVGEKESVDVIDVFCCQGLLSCKGFGMGLSYCYVI